MTIANVYLKTGQVLSRVNPHSAYGPSDLTGKTILKFVATTITGGAAAFVVQGDNIAYIELIDVVP